MKEAEENKSSNDEDVSYDSLQGEILVSSQFKGKGTWLFSTCIFGINSRVSFRGLGEHLPPSLGSALPPSWKFFESESIQVLGSMVMLEA